MKTINIKEDILLELLENAFYTGLHHNKSENKTGEEYAKDVVNKLIEDIKKDISEQPTQTINRFILELQNISEDLRNKPLVIDCPNGLEVYPSIKMRWDNPLEMLHTRPDKMVITW